MEFDLKKIENISISILDVYGKLILQLVDNQRFIYGNHKLKWNRLDMASGVYICRFEAGEKVGFQKIVRW